jgi:hypothetical protein
MADNVSTAQLGGLFREAYPEGIIPLAPELAKIYKDLGTLTETEKVGNYYHQPVVLTNEQGVTYGGGASAGTAYSLNSAVAMAMQDAQLQGSEITLPSVVALRSLSKSTGSAKAFRYAMRPILESNMRSHAFRKEVEILYGKSGTGIGTATAQSGSNASRTLTISTASWAVGMWAGQEGAILEIFRSDNGVKVVNSAENEFILASVDPDNKTITVTAESNTHAGALDTAVGATNCYIDFLGARGAAFTNFQTAEGMDYLCTAAAGTTIWNISNTNTLWKPISHSAQSGKLTLGKVLAGINKAVAKGGLDEEVNLYVSAATWADLADSFSASRMLDSSYSTSEGKNGVEKVIYHGANGAINVKIHPVVKEGEAFFVPLKRCMKVGSTDITTNVPGRGDELFVMSASKNGVEFRTYSDMQFFCECPARMGKITTIVNSI